MLRAFQKDPETVFLLYSTSPALRTRVAENKYYLERDRRKARSVLGPKGNRSPKPLQKHTESPLKNSLLINRSRLTGFAFFFPLPALGVSVHISLTFSVFDTRNSSSQPPLLHAPDRCFFQLLRRESVPRTRFMCRSKALTRPRSFLLFLQLTRIWFPDLTAIVKSDSGPVLNSSSSSFRISASVNSDFGLFLRSLR